MFKRTLIGLTIALAIVLVVPTSALAMKVSDGSAFSNQSSAPLISEKTFGMYHNQVGPTGQELRALMLRSEGLNQKYGLGDYATGMSAQERRALTLRSEGLNKKYGLGDYAKTTVVSEMTAGLQQPGQPEQPTVVVSTDSEFNWGDAGIGAGAIFVGIIVAAGAALAVRHRHTPLAH
jgi:hypothetical protein